MSKEEHQPEPPSQPSQPSLMRYAGLGTELAAAIIGLTLAGYWVDYKFGTGRTGLIVGAVVGIVGGMYNFIRQALLLTRQSQSTAKDKEVGRGNDSHHPE